MTPSQDNVAANRAALLDRVDEDEDHAFWWRATGPSLGRLLAVSEYDPQDQARHLAWYRRFIPAALGPRPVAGTPALFQPCPVFDGSACELSTNFQECSTAHTVRFTIEATGRDAGTPADPFNQNETARLLRAMAATGAVPGLALDHFDVFADRFFFPPDRAQALLPRVPARTPLSQVWVAFDLLRGGGVLAKVYFMPTLQWVDRGVPTKDLVFAAARACGECHGRYDEAIAMLDGYLVLGNGDGDAPPVVEMAAVDCLRSADARIKVYLRTNANTLQRVKRLLTLGGRLAGPTIDAGLEALSELWPLLFRLDPPGDADADVDVESGAASVAAWHNRVERAEVFPEGSYCGCAVEMRPGRSEPETKLHMPVRKIPGTDAQICQSLASWFAKRGHAEFGASYQANLEQVLCVRPHSRFPSPPSLSVVAACPRMLS